ncbi:hypothetical protein HK102_008065, partial [Quaeritorhiza haematococci]
MRIEMDAVATGARQSMRLAAIRTTHLQIPGGGKGSPLSPLPPSLMSPLSPKILGSVDPQSVHRVFTFDYALQIEEGRGGGVKSGGVSSAGSGKSRGGTGGASTDEKKSVWNRVGQKRTLDWTCGLSELGHLKGNPLSNGQLDKLIFRIIALIMTFIVVALSTVTIAIPGPMNVMASTTGAEENIRMNGCYADSWEYFVASYGFTMAYLVAVGPFLLWVMRDVSDTHGVKSDLSLTTLIGTFAALGFFVILLFTDSSNSVTWTRANLCLVIVLSFGHLTSVMYPVMLYFANDIQPESAKRGDRSSSASTSSGRNMDFDGGLRDTHRSRGVNTVDGPVKEKRTHTSAKAKKDTTSSPAAHTKPASTNEKLTIQAFDRMLADPDRFSQFKHFAARSFAVEMALFWECYVWFKEQFGTGPAAGRRVLDNQHPQPHESHTQLLGSTSRPPSLLIARARSTSDSPSTPASSTDTAIALSTVCRLIYATFIEPTSEMELNISASQRTVVKDRVERGEFGADMFDGIAGEVREAMFWDVYT